MSKLIAARHAIYEGERETFEETLRRLAYERIIPKEVADVFHALRKAGNGTAHGADGNHSDALIALTFARQLAMWFHRTYGKQPKFKFGPFVPPPEPVDATAALKQEIASLRRKVAESEDAAARANREAEEQALARESVEQRLARDEAAGTLRFRWEERGGPSVTAPTRKGFGSTVLEYVMAEYCDDRQPKVDFDQHGITYAVICSLREVTLSSLVSDTPAR